MSLGDLHDLGNGDERQERRFLEDRHEIVAERRHDRGQGLRYDHVLVGAVSRHVERDAGLPLAARHGLEPGTVDLGAESRVVDRQCQDAGRERRQG